ncbi:hypothetical protein GHT06_018677 [Daphnia sinensis]|uniref:Peptidase A2 domain-containing protein n=1 Tax=Daphnia sinensis TaxID=1820382 RepID=A0AAD5L4L6_9CRUS|nr:hypothetical protein GHT06_018677 [Daphnia sinensis]
MQNKIQEDKPEEKVPTMAHGLSTETPNKKEVVKPGKKSKIGSTILSKLVDRHRTTNTDDKKVSTDRLDRTSTSKLPEKTEESKMENPDDVTVTANQDATGNENNKWWKFRSSKNVEMKNVVNDTEARQKITDKKHRWWNFANFMKLKRKSEAANGTVTPEELCDKTKAGPDTCTSKPPENAGENQINNPDAVADSENVEAPGTEKKKWWNKFSSKTKKMKAVSGDAKQQRDGQKKKTWWKPVKLMNQQATSGNDESVEENSDSNVRVPEVITDVVTTSSNIVEPNTIFTKRTDTYLREETETQRKLALELKSSCNSQAYFIDVSVKGVPIKMMVNTWYVKSFIGHGVWEKLGKPKLQLKKLPFIEANNKQKWQEGECVVDVEYSGHRRDLSLSVLKQSRRTDSIAILGYEWHQALPLDFNSIFGAIQYCKARSDNRQAKKPTLFEYVLQRSGFLKPIISLSEPRDTCQICGHVWDPAPTTEAKLDQKDSAFTMCNVKQAKAVDGLVSTENQLADRLDTMEPDVGPTVPECSEETNLFDETFPRLPVTPNNQLLKLEINELELLMLIHSGTHHSFITEDIWNKMGKPILEPVEFDYVGLFGGKKIKLVGKFMAKVQYEQRTFHLPLLVASNSNRVKLINLHVIGRSWLSSLNLDWNKFMEPVSVDFREETEYTRKLALELETSYDSKEFYITVNVEGVDMEMLVDSGTSLSFVGRDVWKLLGKPKLEPTRISLSTPNGRRIASTGRCFVKVEYSGQKCVLPLYVLQRNECIDSIALIGGNWFPLLQIDFNSLFETIQYCKN